MSNSRLIDFDDNNIYFDSMEIANSISNYIEKSENDDPWSRNDEVNADLTEEYFSFKDSFTDEMAKKAQNKIILDGPFCPLNDSKHYVMCLERKLGKFRGEITSHREKESKKLIEALSKSREIQINSLLNSAQLECVEWDNCDHLLKSKRLLNIVDSKGGAFGDVVRKIAPDHVALSKEELYKLVQMDLLSKQQSEANDQETTIE